MDPEIAQLAGTAATTLIQLLTADIWNQVKGRFTSLWRCAQPERAGAIAEELDATRDDLLAAQRDGEASVAQELGAEWQGRIRRLLAAHPEAVAELRSLLTELAPESLMPPPVVQHAVASGSARVYQAGRDQNFIRR